LSILLRCTDSDYLFGIFKLLSDDFNVTLYQGSPERNHKLWNIASTEIYIPYASAAGMLLHMNGKFTMVKLKASLLS
jgi:hypothetical protein